MTRIHTFKRRVAVALGILLALAAGCSQSDGITGPAPGNPPSGRAGDGTLMARLDSLRADHDLPALAAIMIRGDSIVEMGATGLRACGFAESVTDGDCWHIGSLTKSMTATLAAALVEQGVITWEWTLAETFPAWADSMHPAYRDVNLSELLSHTGGFTGDLLSVGVPWEQVIDWGTPLPHQRLQMTSVLLTLPPEGPRGSFIYSNAGYVVVGTMLETATGRPWEELVQSYVFGPLALTSAGFGPPGVPGDRSEPWGHIENGKNWLAIDPGSPDADVPALLGPAGTVHITLGDYGRYMAAHLAGARGQAGLVSVASFARLHTPANGTEAALGWRVVNGVLMHEGSNGLWTAQVAIDPEHNTALLVVTNAAGPQGDAGVLETLILMGQRFEAAYGPGS